MLSLASTHQCKIMSADLYYTTNFKIQTVLYTYGLVLRKFYTLVATVDGMQILVWA